MDASTTLSNEHKSPESGGEEKCKEPESSIDRTPPNTCLEAALEALRNDMRVIPIIPLGKKPLVSWKEFQNRAPTEQEIRDWFKRWPSANIALLTGEVSRVFVVDLDNGHDPWPPDGCELECGCIVETPNGGEHQYFGSIPGFKNTVGKLGTRIDVRTERGYVVIPPSIGANGKPYKYLKGSILEAKEAPEWLISKLCKTIKPASTPESWVDSECASIPEGRRNSTLAKFAGILRKRGLTEAEILPSLVEINRLRCQPPLDDKEVQQIAKSISKYPATEDIFLGKDQDEFSRDEIGNAKLLAHIHGLDLFYSPELNRWFCWDGTRWNPSFGEIYRRAKEVAFFIRVQAENCQDDDLKKKLWAHYKTTARRAGLENMIKLAQSEPGIEISLDKLDQDFMLFNVLNGTIDLKTGELRSHSRNDLITKISPIHYDPQSTCPRWAEFLNTVMDGDDELIKFLQRAIGYSLTGYTSERAIFIFFGIGANGKSTFIQIILKMMGDYGCRTPTSTLMVKQGSSIPNDIARLKGMRFVSAAEAEYGQRLAEALIKEMTGNESISARFMRAEWFDFVPTHKIFLSTNYKPNIRGGDEAIWARIHLVPFSVCIPPEKQDQSLQQKLAHEFPGILRWAVEGCIEWQRIGLKPPAAVVNATQEYRNEMDIITRFFKEMVVENTRERITIKALYEAFQAWYDDNSETTPISKREFGIRLHKKGIKQSKSNSNRFWEGITLRKDA